MSLGESNTRALVILAAAFLILGNTLLHTSVYGNRNFREDEIVTIHAAGRLSSQQIAWWVATTVHPPGWRILAASWVEHFGTSEAVVRWSSKLLNLLSFALIFQLGKHLVDRRAALYAVALLGLFGFASNSMFELRPYAMLVALASALHLVFLRWLSKPSGRLMVVYVSLGVAAVYTHFYAFPIFAAHALFLFLFRRFDRRFAYHSAAMWIFIALSFTPWIPPLIDSMLGTHSGGYPTRDLPTLVQEIRFRPVLIFEFLLIASPIALYQYRIHSASRSALRWYPLSRAVYPLFLLLATFAIALLANTVWTVLNPRGFASVAMLVALVMALGLWLLPGRIAAVLLVLLYIHAPINIFVQPTNAPYREIVQAMAPTYQNDSIVVSEFKWAWRWLHAAAYYLMDFTPDKMSKQRIFHIVDPHDSANPTIYPIGLENVYKYVVPETFGSHLPAHQQLWHLSEGGGNFPGLDLRDWLKQNYALIQTHAWDEPYFTSYVLSEYAKVPDTSGPIVHMGEALRLYAWELEGSIEIAPCQSVTVASWWQLEAEVDASYSLSIILAAESGDGQLAIHNSIPADVFTTEWETGRFYRDRSTLDVPCAIEDGRYLLLLAAKETMSGNALPLSLPDGTDIGNEYYLTTVKVASS